MIRSGCGVVLFACMAPAAAGGYGDIELGYLATSGNSSTESLNGKLVLDYKGQSWKNAFSTQSVFTRDEDETSAERYAASDKINWDFTERNYLFASVDWEKDLFGGVRERLSETLGLGRHVLVGPVHTLDMEIGAGARQSEDNQAEDEEPDGERNDDFIGRAFVEYLWKLSPTSEFSQTLKAESGESNTFTESATELKLSIVGNLYAVLSYTVRNNSEVPEGTERTDTFTAVKLSYAFGKQDDA